MTLQLLSAIANIAVEFPYTGTGFAGGQIISTTEEATMTQPIRSLVDPGAVACAPRRPEVHVVDDDAAVRRAITRLLAFEDYEVFAYESAEAFLAAHQPDRHGCVILDIELPGQDGVALQHVMAERGSHMPVIFLSGHADVPQTVSAMKQGALDFLVKPVDVTVLLAAISRALQKDDRLRAQRAQRETTESRLATLTPREREVLMHVMEGRLNKQIAADLGTAEKTVKVHRARGMEKMQVRSVAELVRVVERTHPRETDDDLAA
jgi:FixJ family two-component response regulator